MCSPRHVLLFALAAIFPAAAALAAVVLQVDVNDATDSPTDTAPGYTAYVLSQDTLSIPPFTVDVNPAGGAALDDLHRATPADGGALTLAALYRDFIFAAPAAVGNYYRIGLDAQVTGLTPGKKYSVTAWAFDSGSAGARTSDWSLLGLGGPVFGVNNYTFDGAVLPATDATNRFTMTALADANGTLTLRGRQSASTTNQQVVLNGFSIDEQPDAAVAPTTVIAVDFNFRTPPTNTQAGFQEFLLTGTAPATQTSTSRVFGNQTVTLTAVGTALDDRSRTLNDNGPFNESLLLRDFVYATGTGGLDARVEGLAAGQFYLVELWCFDPLTTTLRVSDWTVNGTTFWDDFAINGANAPTTNNDYKMAGVFAASPAGELVIAGRVGSGSAAGQPGVMLNALRISGLTPPVVVDLGHPILSEFMAENTSGITDEDADTSDWIEIWNTTAGPLDLAGWHLTDDPADTDKWTFPVGTTLTSQARLVVWASGKDRRINPAQLHTSFALDKASGSYLALSQPDGTVVAFFTNLPSQRANISYGLTGTPVPNSQGFFQPATPGAANGAAIPGFVSDTTFDLKRGFYAAPIAVHISCVTAGATIYYTTDGSVPTTASTPYPGGAGIPISTTTVLRAKAFLAPLAPSDVDTQTYVFNAHVQNQPAAPAGWPATWGFDSEVNGTVPADYEMDPVVVASTLPAYGVAEALAALPAISITLNPADFHSVGGGIYTNPRSVGDAWEKACSIEYFEADGAEFHTNCGIRVHGNSSRRPFRMQKHSFRLAFRSEYGDGKLDYRLFGDTTVRQFDKLILHAFFTDGWGLVSWDQARYRPDDSVAIHDRFMKQCYRDMGWLGDSGRFVHLYVNGLYWGMYEVGERVADDFLADHLGGLPTDYDLMGDFVALQAGSATAWNSLFTFVNANDLSGQANYDTVAAQVDLVNFVDYYLLHVHGDSEDWPSHNGYAYRNHVAGNDNRWRMLTWDQELSFDRLVNVDRLSVNAPNTTIDKTPGRLLAKLRANGEFRLLFADRAHKHLHNGGALSVVAEQARWQALANKIDKAIVAESARWGDTADATPYGNTVTAGRVMKRETDWLPTINTVKNTHIPNLQNTANSYATITELRAQNPRFYPLTEPPAFSQHGGNVPTNYALTITAPAGLIYYTLDGTDPRTPYTGAFRGTPYTGPVILTQTGIVKARVLNGAEWSALTETQFIVGVAASSANLAIGEVYYHPALSEEHEFIELVNKSAVTIDLTGVHFTAGVTFTFPDGLLLTAGARILVVRNQIEFTAQFGAGLPIAGEFAGALENKGEEIAIAAADGTEIFRFIYDDKGPWPTAADSLGRSLVLRSPNADPASPANWRSSVAAGGTPGMTDSVVFTGSANADIDADGLLALIEHALGTSDTVASAQAHPVAAIETFDIGAGPQQFLTVSARHNLAADDTALTAELSSDLVNWSGAPAAVVFLGESIAANGVATLKWRAAQPVTALPQPQFFHLRAVLSP